MSYQFHPAAEEEYLESIAYFESRRKGLGASFFAEFENLMLSVCESPLRYRIEIKPEIRIAQMKRFPYSILYRDKSGIVQVLAVAHHSRRPDYWLGRI